MKTWYEGHDSIYKANKEKGLPGWKDEKDTIESKEKISLFLNFNNIPKSGKLLELGCGSGDIAIWLSEKDYEVFGVDISDTAINWAKEKIDINNKKCNFFRHNLVTEDYFKNEYFDIIIDSLCLHCIIGEDRKILLSKVFNLLKQDGFFMVRTMCGEPINKQIKNTFDYKTRTTLFNDISTRYLGLPEDIENEIKEIGFKILFSEIEKSNNEEDQDIIIIYAQK